ncbi:uncharacterized protein ACR2FA_006580 [Aphomia sociella]
MLPRISITKIFTCYVKSLRHVSRGTKPEIPKNLLASVYSAQNQKENGVVYDRKPFKITLEAGKTYHWCLCGRSKSQPMCDGTHKDVFLKIAQRPIRFSVEKTKDYWLCNCKHTKNRPFCDGAHKQKEIQEASTIKV